MLQPDLSLGDFVPEAVRDGMGDVGLRAGAAHAEGDGEHPLSQEPAVLFPEEVLDVPPVQRPEAVQRVQVVQPLSQVLAKHVEAPVPQALDGKGEAGEPDALVGNTVLIQPANRAPAGGQVDDPALPGVLRHPGPVDLRIADHAVGGSVAGHVRRDGGGIERCDQRKRVLVNRLHHARAHPAVDEALQPHHLEGWLGHVTDRIETGDVLQLVQQPEDSVPDDGPALRPGEKLVAPAQPLPEPVLGGGGVVCLAEGHDPVFRDVTERLGGPLVAKPHVRGDDPCPGSVRGPGRLGEPGASPGGFGEMFLSAPRGYWFHPFSFPSVPSRAPGNPRSRQG